jgi:Raf kinase inhibitor-like YbhB/YbcL family protein
LGKFHIFYGFVAAKSAFYGVKKCKAKISDRSIFLLNSEFFYKEDHQMKLTSQSFREGQMIPGEYAFCVMDTENPVKLSTNKNPHLAWDDVPAGTQSFALIVHDVDVPSRGDDVNQAGREIPETLPRVDFFHWVLMDIPASQREILAGTHSHAVTPRGKSGPVCAQGMKHGINDYTAWFAGDVEMGGDYYGYDGPCPPWNDSLIHHYIFTLYALDIPQLNIDGQITGPAVRAAIQGRILAQAQCTGIYTLNPRLIP